MQDNITACDNKECLMSKECLRHALFLQGAKEYTTNGGNPNKACKKFIQK